MNKIKMQDRIRDAYDEEGTFEQYDKPLLIKCERKIFSKYFKKRGKILDIGCNCGRVSISLAKMGYDVTGIDISEKSIKQAKILSTKYKVECEFITASTTNLPFEDDTFDYVLFPFNTIEALPSKKFRYAAMCEASRCLRFDGLVLFSVHSRLYPRYFLWFLKTEYNRFIAKLTTRLNVKSLNRDENKQNFIDILTKSEIGSCIIKEYGGLLYFPCYFSTFYSVGDMIKKSNLVVRDVYPIEEHSPLFIDADLLNAKILKHIRAPELYYICEKKQR